MMFRTMALILASAFASTGSAVSGQDVGKAQEATPKDIADWARAIQQNYPAEAEKAGIEGAVTMQLDVSEKGAVTACTVTKSSQSAALDQAACRGMAKHAQYFPALDYNGDPVASVVNSTIRYSLKEQPKNFTYPVPKNEEKWRAAVFDAAFDDALREASVMNIVFQLVVDEAGYAVGCGMNLSSGNAELDRQGCAALQKHARFEPAALLDGTTIPGAYWVGHSLEFEM